MSMDLDEARSAGAVDVEALGRRLAARAALRPDFMAQVVAIWERANPERPAAALLGVGEDAMWRLSVTPRPAGPGMVRQAMAIADELGLGATGLLNMIRFAETAGAFSAASADGELLMAALDADGDGDEVQD